MDQYNIRFGFFSSGVKERNDILVAELLKLALGESRYLEIAPCLKIFSRDDLSVNSNDRNKKIKDLRKALDPTECLENTVLVDDDRSYAHPKQIKNMFLIPFSVNDSNFRSLSRSDDALRRINSIFYITGVLFAAIENVNISGSSLTHELFKLQYIDCGNEKYERFFEIFYNRNTVYHPEQEVIFNKIDGMMTVGERYLKTINPALQMLKTLEFFSPHYFPLLPPLHRENSMRRALYLEAANERKKIEISECNFWCNMDSYFFKTKRIIKSIDEEPLKRQEYQTEYESDVRKLTLFGENQGRPSESNFKMRRPFMLF